MIKWVITELSVSKLSMVSPGNHFSITIPDINNRISWEIPSYIMTTIATKYQFHGRDDEDTPTHISRFTRILSTLKLQGATNDAIFLHLFQFSFAGWATTWLDSQPARTFTTWEVMRSSFLKKYFPPAKASCHHNQIHSFRMSQMNPTTRLGNVFKTCYLDAPNIVSLALVEKLYNGLDYATRARFNTSAGGHLMEKKNVTQFKSYSRALLRLNMRKGQSIGILFLSLIHPHLIEVRTMAPWILVWLLLLKTYP